MVCPVLFFILLALPCPLFGSSGPAKNTDSSETFFEFPLSEATYAKLEAQEAVWLGREPGLWERLRIRAAADPFNVVATAIFLLMLRILL